MLHQTMRFVIRLLLVTVLLSVSSYIVWGPGHSRTRCLQIIVDPRSVAFKSPQALVADMQRGNNDSQWRFDPDCMKSLFSDCTPHTFLRWSHRIPTCQDLLDNGITSLVFLGDSFVRHAFAATAIHLSGNYQKGALRPKVNDQRCFYGGQFAENVAVCRYRLMSEVRLCHNKVLIVREADKHAYKWDNPGPYLKNFSTIVWGGGRHTVDKKVLTSKKGIFDAETVAREILSEQCRPWDRTMAAQKVIWLNTHVYPRRFKCAPPNCAEWADPLLKQIRQFNEAMPAELERLCGIKKFTSVWNETFDLVNNHLSEVESMTYDMTHWGMQVNLLLAHKILELAIQDTQK